MITFMYIIMIALASFLFVYLTYEPKCGDNDRYRDKTPIDPYTYDDGSCEESDNEIDEVDDSHSDDETDRVVEEADSEDISEPLEDNTLEPIATDDTQEAPATKDDLSIIKGIGPKIGIKLHDMGITSFAQIAAWTQSDVDEVNKVLSFSGRIERDEWIAQALALAESTTK